MRSPRSASPLSSTVCGRGQPPIAGPVVLAHGDFHELLIDHPFADLPNVTRVQTYGEEIDHWIEVHVDPRDDQVFSFEPHKVGRQGARFATFNASLNRNAPGQLVADLSTPDNAQARTVAEIIQRTEPDVLLLNEFDFDPAGQAIDLFRNNYLRVGQNGADPVSYPYAYVAPSNTGIPSGFDLNNDGTVGGPDDAFGFGLYEGQFGMAILSRHPIDEESIRTFQLLRWDTMPGNLIPDGFYTPEERAALRLSSKSHWDVPVVIGDETVHVLASHPTPPVFDGPEDRNGRRNHDEIRLWADYVRPSRSRWIVDDAGQQGGLRPNESFVVMGDLNADPVDGDSVPGAAQQLLDNPRVDSRFVPSSEGAVEQAALQGGANVGHRGDPAFDTADFADSAPGNLRVDYVLPSRKGLRVLDGAVFWPLSADPLFRLVGTFPFPSSDHRLVYLDLAT